jgi:hypothetical protein
VAKIAFALARDRVHRLNEAKCRRIVHDPVWRDGRDMAGLKNGLALWACRKICVGKPTDVLISVVNSAVGLNYQPFRHRRRAGEDSYRERQEELDLEASICVFQGSSPFLNQPDGITMCPSRRRVDLAEDGVVLRRGCHRRLFPAMSVFRKHWVTAMGRAATVDDQAACGHEQSGEVPTQIAIWGLR